MSGELVLVTGGSGFLGAHCVVRLLAAGYRVRTTVRSPDREPAVRAMVAAGGVESAEALTFAVADLTSDAGWAEAVRGCAHVLHVASPFPLGAPEHEDDLIGPARDGTLRVLRAARDEGVERVVLTSSFAAVGYSGTAGPFTEDDWTDPSTPGLSAYVKSKAVAERAAWDFVEREGGPELVVVNPVGIFGPVLGSDYSSSIELLRGLLTGRTATVPKISTSVVDVRDVADLHLLAMTRPEAAGQRYLAVAGEPMTFTRIAEVLRSRLGADAARVPTAEEPSLPPSRSDPTLRQLGVVRRVSNAKARRDLGWSPRSNEDTVVATARSLVALGLVADQDPSAAVGGVRAARTAG